ncbi:MAG: HAD family phosphatase [Alphaproteobacteria bacterium]|nr:HAD family phosphatase [Alphaproteobacteria bacterium]
MVKPVANVLFDLGGVLIDWNPEYLYVKLIPDEGERRFFLTEICSQKWNERQDAGRLFAEAEAELIDKHPDKKDLIEAWRLRYDETMRGPIDGSVALLKDLCAACIPVYALTNWSSETFPAAQARFDFLTWFRGIVVSGDEKIAKPDPRIYMLAVERFGLDPEETLYIDDKDYNVEAAKKLGFYGHCFTSPEKLKAELLELGLLKKERTPHAHTCCR